MLSDANKARSIFGSEDAEGAKKYGVETKLDARALLHTEELPPMRSKIKYRFFARAIIPSVFRIGFKT